MPVPSHGLPHPRLWVLWILLILAHPADAQRRDVVVMKNGDRLTGEVKKLEHGQLFIDTSYVESAIPVDWLKVERVESTFRYQLEVSDGKRLVGTIQKISSAEAPNRDFIVRNAGIETRLRASDVVALQSQKINVWRQMKGAVNFGASYVSGSTDSAINLDASTSYPSTKFEIGGNLTSSVSGKTESGRTNRSSPGLEASRL